jgi:L-ascorbate metabolism protein UlaG (beta-lactamase superfamily)
LTTFLVVLAVVSACAAAVWWIGSPQYRGPLSDHFDGRHFFNRGPYLKKSLGSVLKWRWTRNRAPWPKEPWSPVSRSQRAPLPSGQLRVTFVNHSTVLFESGESAVLVDPVWSNRVGPLGLMGPVRAHPPGVALEDLPRLDAVLISHDHYDHLDLATLRRLAAGHAAAFVSGLGNGYWLKEAGAARVYELDWRQSLVLSPTLTLHFVEARHWSGRSLGDRFNTLWGGFVLELNGFKIYISGDTGYSEPMFERIKREYGVLNLCVLPLGAYEPRWLMQDNHLNPEEALRTQRILGCTQSLGVHFGTFQISDESRHKPIADLDQARRKLGVSEQEFFTLAPGESRCLSR